MHELDEGMVPLSVLFPYAPIPEHFRRDRWVLLIGQSYSSGIRGSMKAAMRISHPFSSHLGA
jgi:hypothetical protein